MEEIDPILNFDLQLGRETLQIDISARPHTITGECVADTHNHPKFELHFLLGGSCHIDMDDTNCTLHQRQAVIIAPGQYHRMRTSDSGFERMSVGLSVQNGALRRALQRAAAEHNIYPMSGEMLHLCRGILSESECSEPFRREVMQAKVSQLVLAVLRVMNLQESDRTEGKEWHRMLYTIDMYFERNLAQNPGADDLARQVYLSRRQLNRILQANYGMGFREKLLQARMNKAKWLLRRTEKSVSVIAGEVGYTYDSAFREAFCRQVGVTPQAYRLQHKQTGVQEEAGK